MSGRRLPWFAIAPAVLAGMLAALAVLAWWALRGGGGLLVEDPAVAAGNDTLTSSDSPRAPTPLRGGQGPVIGALVGEIEGRLGREALPTTPITGGIRIAVGDAVWTDAAGRAFARVPAVTARLDGGRLRAGDVVLRDVDVRGGTVRLVQAADGSWNYEQPMAGLLEGDGGGGGGGRERTVLLAGARLRGVRVEVDTNDRDFVLGDLDARATEVVFSRPGLPEPLIRLASAQTILEVEGFEEAIPVTATDAVLRVPDASVLFTVERVALEEGVFTDIEGTWDPELGGWGVVATGRAPALSMAELGSLRPELLPPTGTAAFAWRIEPAADDNLIELSDLIASSGDSRVAGSLAFVMTPEEARFRDADLALDPLNVALLEPFTGPLPYTGFLRGQVIGSAGAFDFDLTADLVAENGAAFTTDLDGSVVLGADGAELRRLVADVNNAPLAALSAYLPGLPLTGTISGRVALTGPPTAAPLDLDVRFELAQGVATAVGTLDLTGPVPAYDVEGRLLGVEMDQLFAPALPPVALTARYTLTGRGTDPASLEAAATVDGRWTGWQAAPGDTVALAARVAGGTVSVQTLQTRLATLDLSADGTWRFVEPVEGAVAYELAVTDIRPFGPYVPLIGDGDAAGSLAATGTLSGPLSALRAEGALEGRDLHVGAWGVATVDATYGGVLRDSLPELDLQLAFTELTTPTAGDYTDGTVDLQAAAPTFALDLAANRVGGGGVELVADGTLPRTGPRDLILQEAMLEVREERWVLAQPAAIRWGGVPGIQVEALEVTNAAGAGRLFVSGTVWPPGEGAARLEVAALPVGELQELFGMPARLAGDLSGSADVAGPPAAPTVDAAFQVSAGEIAGVPVDLLEGTLAYAAGRLSATAAASLDTAGTARLELTLPAALTLGGSPSFQVADAGALEGMLSTDGVSLTPLGEVSPRLTAVTGRVTGEVTLGGTVDAPSFNGALQLADGGVTILELNQRYEGARGRVVFAGRTATVEDLTVTSGGTATLGGSVRFEQFTQPVLALTLALRDFRPVGVDNQEDAALRGSLQLNGPFAEPVLTGNLVVRDGYLPVPRFGGGLPDLDIYAPPTALELDADDSPSFVEALRIRDLAVDVQDDVWFEMDEARAQLGGDLTVNRQGDELRVTGTLEGTRGTYVLVAGPIVRQFDLVRAQVRFLGSPQPNPALDITARRAILDPNAQQFEVTVRVGGTLRNPTLGLASADAPAIPESELLSFLLFGQPSFALQGGGLPGEQLLEQTYLGGLTELFSLELSQGIADQLSLDLLTIRLGGSGPAGIGGATVVLGRELDEDLFVTVETTLAGLSESSDALLNTWAARLEWAFDRRSTLRLGVEPVYRGRLIRGLGAALPNDRSQQQFILEVRRRWTY